MHRFLLKPKLRIPISILSLAAVLHAPCGAQDEPAWRARVELALDLWRAGKSAEALAVMDEVIDGEAGGGEVDPSVRRLRGRMREAVRDFPGAEADLTEWIERGEPTAGDWHLRGACRYRDGRIDAALADWDRELELDPSRAPSHWQRGIALAQAGRHAEGRRQFELHRTVNPNDVENALWHFVCVAADEGTTVALAALIETRGDPRRPMSELFDLYRGAASPADVIEAARRTGAEDSPARRQAMFYADLYLGLYHEAHGRGSEADRHLRAADAAAQAAGETPGARHYMHDVAAIHLRLRAPRPDPGDGPSGSR